MQKYPVLNHASIKFGKDILKEPLFHKRVLAMQKFKMAAFFQDGCHPLANCLIFKNMGVTDAFSMVSNPIQPPICSSSKVIFVTLAIPSPIWQPKVVLILSQQMSLAIVNSFSICRGVFRVIDSN